MTYIQNIKSRLLSIRQKFPLVDSRLNQIQGVHLKFIITNCQIPLSKCFKMILIVFLSKNFLGREKTPPKIFTCARRTRYSPPALETF